MHYDVDYRNNFTSFNALLKLILMKAVLGTVNKMSQEVSVRKLRMAEKYIIKAFTLNDDNNYHGATRPVSQKIGLNPF